MLLTPRYDDPLVLPARPAARRSGRCRCCDSGDGSHRSSAGSTTSSGPPPSRCEGWSVQDVIAHLVSANQFWAFSIGAALGGEPTRFLATFDPVASTVELVEAVRSRRRPQRARPLRRDERGHRRRHRRARRRRVVDDRRGAAWPRSAPRRRAARAVGLVDPRARHRAPARARPRSKSPTRSPAASATSPRSARPSRWPRLDAATGAIAVEATDPDVRFVVDVGESVVVRAGDAPSDALRLTARPSSWSRRSVSGCRSRARCPSTSSGFSTGSPKSSTAHRVDRVDGHR